MALLNARVLLPAAAGLTAAMIRSSKPPSHLTTCTAQTEIGRFKGKTIVITGGGGSFGTEGAKYFVNEGANVVLIDSNQKSLDFAVEQVTLSLIQKKSADANVSNLSVCLCDVRDSQSVSQVFDFVESKYGRVDCLWNNAGSQGSIKPLLDYETDDFLRVQHINVVGAFNVLKACAKKMALQSTGGSIVQSGSIAATDGTPGMCAYVASKAALHALSLTAAKDLAPFRIRVNTIAPGYIGPDDGFMWRRQIDLRTTSKSPYYKTDFNEEASRALQSVPLKRFGEVHEVVMAVAFLLSEEASFITGAKLDITGGT